jgi:REP element-mobilizing transposase RayT
VQDFDATMPSQSRPRPETPVRKPMPGELDETRPHSITEVASRVMLEPISPGLYNLTYACLLVPRFSSHYITGDLAARLTEWLPQICIAFGWRLEFLAVRPEYVQWMVNVPPSTSPGYLMRIVRQQTSEKIFTDFVRLKRENPSGDFWAPGYLIMSGTQPHPPQLVKDYIKQTRTRQGYSESRK